MKKRLAAAVCAAALLSGCSASDSGDTVRSGDGPTPADSDSSGEEPESSADDGVGSASVEPTTSPLLNIKGKFAIPDGVDGKLSVVVIGQAEPASGTVPVVIRNMTASPLANLEVSGTARDGAGKLMGSGSSQGFAPELLNPGEWAFGYVYIDGVKAAKDTEFDFTATGSEPDDFLGSADVEIVEVALTKGDFGDNLTGILKNPTDEEVSGPIDVSAACFDKSGSLVSTQSGFADSDSMAPGGTSSFSLDLFDDPCEFFAMGSSGYNF
ncbi:hypothetical protein [Nocardioides sp. zg-1228]|uniref:hypothetical protein n=1 Tax=Nocardioides sp. zg-1228 TaxID=2763008 RepID=UPI001642A546|nr:hypothetical protein [Nocardioides sp. zg-1228]MBC2934738.1 hypothetical protein [Nocardioides sp. zg-1228]QSF58466.1 hypothetical protein JX575_04475 [Nocardioides sp. zg-1228]